MNAADGVTQQGQSDQCNEGELPVRIKQVTQHGQGGRAITQYRCERPAHQARHLLRVADHFGDRFRWTDSGVQAGIGPQQRLNQCTANVEHSTRRHTAQEIASTEGEEASGREQCNQCQGHHPNRKTQLAGKPLVEYVCQHERDHGFCGRCQQKRHRGGEQTPFVRFHKSKQPTGRFGKTGLRVCGF